MPLVQRSLSFALLLVLVLICVQHFMAPWIVAHQAPLPMDFSRQKYWNGVPFPIPRDLPAPRVEPASLASPLLAGGFFTTSATWEAPLFFQFSCVWLFATPWTAAHQASLSITNSQSLLKLTSIESVMPSNHLILCRPLLHLPSIFPSITGSFQMSQLFASGGQRIGVSASASVLPMNTQDLCPLL